MGSMRIPCSACVLVWLLANAVASTGHAVESKMTVGGGVRSHMEHSAFSKLPFADGDFSYGAVMEWHENEAYWQLAVMYAPELTRYPTANYAITPQLNLLMKDNYWCGGMGVLWTMVNDEVEGSDWTNVYYQFILGVTLPIAMFRLDLQGFYPFKGFEKLGDFDFADIEFGAWLTYMF